MEKTDKLAQLRELFETWLASRPSFRTTVEVRAAWEWWKANTAVAAMLDEHDAQPAQAAQPVGVPEVFALLEIFQSWIGPRRPDKNDDNRDLWDRVAAVLAAAPQPPAQPSADAEDAARYRWLTNHCFDESLFNESEDKCEVDSRIDAARAAEGEGNAN